jgi:glycosyltransferase involved in cell wall biosynthesis
MTIPCERIRVLLVIDNLNLGGTEKQCFEIARGLNRERFDARVVALNKEGPLSRNYAEERIPLYEYRISRGFYRPRSFLQILRLMFFFRKESFHVVQTHGFYSTVPGVMAAKAAKVPVVLAAKRDLNEFLSRKQVWVEKSLWRFCDRIIVNARAVKGQMTTRERVAAKSIVVIPNGLDSRYFEAKPRQGENGEILIGMVANFREQKDHRTFLDSAALILKQYPSARFVCVGNGPTQPAMEAYAGCVGVSDSVTFPGRIEGAELVALRSRFTITVLASTNEGMPNVVMESMALGVPVVANPSGGVGELVEDGITGFLFPYKRSDVLSEKILFLLSNPAIRRTMGETSRHRMQEGFTVDRMIRRYEDLYVSLYQRKRGKCAGRAAN